MSASRILVTGGAGYIGSHTCKALKANGFEPVTYDNLVAGYRDAVRWGPFLFGDVRDAEALAEVLSAYRVAAVLHFAGFAYVGESMVDPAKYFDTNVTGTLTLLDACRYAGVDKVVFSSSCATYGVPDRTPIAETSPQRPISPYGRSKLFAEQMLADEAAAYGLHYVALRYFNAAGADPAGEIGERHCPETRLIPLALAAASGRSGPLEVFGDDYSTPDGTCVRDYIHVSDLGRAHVYALLYILDGGENLAVNLGTGNGISVKEVLSSVRRVTGRPVPFVVRPRREGDPPILYADPALARARLGFTTDLSDIESIVSTAAHFLAREGAQ